MKTWSLLASINLTATVLGLTSCGDDITRPINDQQYPTTLERLTPDSLESLTRMFTLANPDVCFRLDAFGLISTGGACLPRGAGVGATIDTVRVVQLAHEFLAGNTPFTGVTPATTLKLKSISRASSYDRYYKVIFQPQEFEDLRVERTLVAVLVDTTAALGVFGHHYPSIYVPPLGLPEESITRSLIGLEIAWYDIAGLEHVLVVNAESVRLPARRVVFPLETDRGMELRVAWRCTVEDEYGHEWYVFVDFVTGEVLESEALFIS